MKKTDISTKLKNLRIEEIKGCKIYSIEQLEAVKRSNFEML